MNCKIELLYRQTRNIKNDFKISNIQILISEKSVDNIEIDNLSPIIFKYNKRETIGVRKFPTNYQTNRNSTRRYKSFDV